MRRCRSRQQASTHCEITINTVTENIKAARGTKRVCQACETRFYDLARAPILCPSCGALYTAVARPTVGAVGRVTAPTGKTGWRSKPIKRPTPQPPVDDREEVVTEIAQDVAEETPNTVPDDDLVLEQEPDDADVADLVGRDAEEPKER
ncbi:MAG: hypothetical protein HC869_02420 [Rhodospirillales bacterium]|nr:hypothetical protein [Rhodospirillales bacterium]